MRKNNENGTRENRAQLKKMKKNENGTRENRAQ
jgi:hypothetical protein